MLYTLLIVACLAADPMDCRVYEQPVSNLPSNPSAAFVQAQSLVAEWEAQHPALFVSKWKMQPGRGV